MILLDSVQILDAVRRSLDEHVLPKLDDDFARVQMAAAQKALAEVSQRLTGGDPCAVLNAELDASVRELAARLSESSPDYARDLEKAVAEARADEPRERSRELGEALWQLVEREDEPAAEELMAILRAQAMKSATEDAAWMCLEAIHSLM